VSGHEFTRADQVLNRLGFSPWGDYFQLALSYFFDAIGDYPKRQQLKHKANSQKLRAKAQKLRADLATPSTY